MDKLLPISTQGMAVAIGRLYGQRWVKVMTEQYLTKFLKAGAKRSLMLGIIEEAFENFKGDIGHVQDVDIDPNKSDSWASYIEPYDFNLDVQPYLVAEDHGWVQGVQNFSLATHYPSVQMVFHSQHSFLMVTVVGFHANLLECAVYFDKQIIQAYTSGEGREFESTFSPDHVSSLVKNLESILSQMEVGFNWQEQLGCVQAELLSVKSCVIGSDNDTLF